MQTTQIVIFAVLAVMVVLPVVLSVTRSGIMTVSRTRLYREAHVTDKELILKRKNFPGTFDFRTPHTIRQNQCAQHSENYGRVEQNRVVRRRNPCCFGNGVIRNYVARGDCAPFNRHFGHSARSRAASGARERRMRRLDREHQFPTQSKDYGKGNLRTAGRQAVCFRTATCRAANRRTAESGRAAAARCRSAA